MSIYYICVTQFKHQSKSQTVNLNGAANANILHRKHSCFSLPNIVRPISARMEKMKPFSNCWVITTPAAAWLNVSWLTAEDELSPCREPSKWEPCEKLHQLLFATIRQKSLISSVFLKRFHHVPPHMDYELRNDVPLEDRRWWRIGGEEINSERRKIDKTMSEGGNRNCERKSKDFPISSSFSFPFFLPPPSHFYLCTVFLLHSLFTHHAVCWITHAYLTVPHLQKQWTYSLAFRVLMKAPILVASLLFPHISSKLISSRLTSPALCYTIGSTVILQLGRLACVFFFFYFLSPVWCKNSITEALTCIV